MFFFRHPRPVVDPRPVAELTVSVEQRVAPTLASVALKNVRRPARRDPAIRFTVRYGLREYLAIVADFLPTALRERGKPVERIGPGTKLLLAVVATPLFLYKTWRIGSCRFDIDAQGLTRHSRCPPLRLPWHDVQAVHHLGRGYLVRKAGGALPLPYRCFSAEERQRFERWAAAAAAAPGP
jgi:hypothetical protein